MGKHWTFRGDKQLDPILREWTDQNEKSFHVRQALRQYLFGVTVPTTRIQIPDIQSIISDDDKNIELSFDDWR